jgi:hypothetical protein
LWNGDTGLLSLEDIFLRDAWYGIPVLGSNLTLLTPLYPFTGLRGYAAWLRETSRAGSASSMAFFNNYSLSKT